MPVPRLLVVDDDPYTRSALENLLSRRGWVVDLASTVAEGLARLDPSTRCLVLDLQLPDGDGLAVLHAARSRCPGVRVAICSGTEDPARVASIRLLKPELLLHKPIELASLFSLCDRTLAAG